MKKALRKLHLWLSIPFGIFITLICLSGASLIFEAEITRWLQPERYYVEQVGEKTLPLGKLAARVAETLPEGVEVTGVTLFSDPERTAQVNITKRHSYVYVDPYTGTITGESKRPAFFSFMFKLHRWMLGGADSFGKKWVGISTLLFIIILITGVIIWWPRTLEQLGHRLKISANKGWNKFWHDLHVAAGMYVLIFVLAMALTGLTWSFPWYRSGFYKVFGVEMQQGGPGGHGGPGGAPQGAPQGGRDGEARQGGRPENRGEMQAEHRGEGRPKNRGGMRPESRPAEAEGAEAGFERSERGEHGATREGVRGFAERNVQAERNGEGHEGRSSRGGEPWSRRFNGGPDIFGAGRKYALWQKVYLQLKEENPAYSQITVSDGKASVSFDKLGNRRAADSYTFDTRTGAITSKTLYKDSDRAGKLRGWIYSVHVGNWGGVLTRILAFLSALIGASLPITGYYLWIHRLVKGHPHHGEKEHGKKRH